MSRWKSLQIGCFRRLEGIQLDALGLVNLLVGKNNSGKTSILEALAIACNPLSPLNWINTSWERELKSSRTPVLEALNWIFPHKVQRQNGFEGSIALSGILVHTENGPDAHTDAEIRIDADYREFRQISLNRTHPSGLDADLEIPGEFAAQLRIKLRRKSGERTPLFLETASYDFEGGKFNAQGDDNPILPHQLVSPVSHRTNRQLLAAVDQVLENRLKGEVVRLMQLLAEDVDDIEIRSPQGQGAVIQIHHAGIGHVPLSVEGDGMRRALGFASAAALAKDGILLLDEIETALHPDALADIFGFLVRACRSTRTQLFVTTHSLEAVDAILESMAEDLGDIVAFRLPRRGTDLPIKRIGGPTLRALRHDGGLDIR